MGKVSFNKTIGVLKELQRFIGMNSSLKYSVALGDAIELLIRFKKIVDGKEAFDKTMKGE